MSGNATRFALAGLPVILSSGPTVHDRAAPPKKGRLASVDVLEGSGRAPLLNAAGIYGKFDNLDAGAARSRFTIQ
jgi:hypothetical protein